MFNKKKNSKTSYGIVGVGRFGQALAIELAHAHAELVVLDRDEEKIREMRDITENAYVVKTLDKKSLSETGIQNCDVAVICIGESIDTSILTTLNLVSMGIPTVISKATSAEHGIILEKLGAQVVYPERDMAIRLASRLDTARVLDIVQLSEKINVTKIKVSKRMVNKTVEEVNLRSHFGLNIIALENDGRVMEIIHPKYIFREQDILYLTGTKEGIIKFNAWEEANK